MIAPQKGKVNKYSLSQQVVHHSKRRTEQLCEKITVVIIPSSFGIAMIAHCFGNT